MKAPGSAGGWLLAPKVSVEMMKCVILKLLDGILSELVKRYCCLLNALFFSSYSTAEFILNKKTVTFSRPQLKYQPVRLLAILFSAPGIPYPFTSNRSAMRNSSRLRSPTS